MPIGCCSHYWRDVESRPVGSTEVGPSGVVIGVSGYIPNRPLMYVDHALRHSHAVCRSFGMGLVSSCITSPSGVRWPDRAPLGQVICKIRSLQFSIPRRCLHPTSGAKLTPLSTGKPRQPGKEFRAGGVACADAVRRARPRRRRWRRGRCRRGSPRALRERRGSPSGGPRCRRRDGLRGPPA